MVIDFSGLATILSEFQLKCELYHLFVRREASVVLPRTMLLALTWTLFLPPLSLQLRRRSINHKAELSYLDKLKAKLYTLLSPLFPIESGRDNARLTLRYWFYE